MSLCKLFPKLSWLSGNEFCKFLSAMPKLVAPCSINSIDNVEAAFEIVLELVSQINKTIDELLGADQAEDNSEDEGKLVIVEDISDESAAKFCSVLFSANYFWKFLFGANCIFEKEIYQLEKTRKEIDKLCSLLKGQTQSRQTILTTAKKFNSNFSSILLVFKKF